MLSLPLTLFMFHLTVFMMMVTTFNRWRCGSTFSLCIWIQRFLNTAIAWRCCIITWWCLRPTQRAQRVWWIRTWVGLLLNLPQSSSKVTQQCYLLHQFNYSCLALFRFAFLGSNHFSNYVCNGVSIVIPILILVAILHFPRTYCSPQAIWILLNMQSIFLSLVNVIVF